MRIWTGTQVAELSSPEWRGALERAIEQVGEALVRAADALSLISEGDIDRIQGPAYSLALATASFSGADSLATAFDRGRIDQATAAVSVASCFRSLLGHLEGRWIPLGLEPMDIRGEPVETLIRAGYDLKIQLASLEAWHNHSAFLESDLLLIASEFRRFVEHTIQPMAQQIHLEDRDVPEDIIEGLASMGAFGMSIPEAYGGSLAAGSVLASLIATEELSRGSLSVGGSVITRSEILARVLLRAGTERQKARWLPDIAAGRRMVAIAVTEPQAGSDVAAIQTVASPRNGDYRLTGSKTWATFAGRADLLLVLARTTVTGVRDRSGLSLFVVEKPPRSGREFEIDQVEGGRLTGRGIATIGYRGLHSFELFFDDWLVPAADLVGEQTGVGEGFAIQMGGFAAGRLQTAARAIGLMAAAIDAALLYSRERETFGKKLIEHSLMVEYLANMVGTIQSSRAVTYRVGGSVDGEPGLVQAAMAKILACRGAERVTRDAMQVFGAYGYASESPVSRYFVDARVLSIFEGTEEILALKVLARKILESPRMATGLLGF